ncbi:MAG: tryptophan synthase subunit alpha [Acidimicrobiales bacterium]
MAIVDVENRDRKRLVIYLMADPDTPALSAAAVEGGADVIEIGFPFSDPLADGPVIRRAAERALSKQMRTARCIEVVADARERLPSTPIVPMTYSSLFEAYGWERLDQDLRRAGATSVIVADLPADQRPELHRVQLVAPTTTDDRICLAAQATEGWLYLVTVIGVTGARGEIASSLPALAERVRKISPVPVYAGFGISSPDQAKSVSELVDGVVVGSRAVEVAEHGAESLREYVRSLRQAIDSDRGPDETIPEVETLRRSTTVGGRGGD